MISTELLKSIFYYNKPMDIGRVLSNRKIC